MKRLFVLCLVVVALLALASSAFAATSAGITVTVTLQSVAMTLDTSTWPIGVVAPGSLSTSPSITAKNTGTVAEDFTIATTATSPDNWAPGGASGVDQYLLQVGSVTINTTPVALASNIPANGTTAFALKFTAPAAGSAATGADTFTVTVSAAAH